MGGGQIDMIDARAVVGHQTQSIAGGGDDLGVDAVGRRRDQDIGGRLLLQRGPVKRVGVEFIRASNNSIMRVLTASGTRWVTMTNGLILGQQ
jgi:hypothetical protein